MAATTEYRELIEFLTHKNIAVQSQALKILSSYSGDPDTEFIALIQADPSAIVRPILRMVETDDKELVEDGLMTLVNLCAIDSVVECAVLLSAVRRICDSLNTRQVMVELHCMLLANLTRLPVGVDSLLSIPGIFRGVLLKYAAVATEEVDHLGAVIINGSSVEKGRRILCELQTDSQGYTHCLLLQCLARCLSIRRRRHAVLQMLRNVALDTECHDAIAASGILINMCYFLYPEADGRREDSVHKSITEHGVGLATDVETRATAAEVLICVLRSETGRDMMRSIGVYEVVRLWDLEETEVDIKDKLYDIAMATHLNEEELRTGELQDAPSHAVQI